MSSNDYKELLDKISKQYILIPDIENTKNNINAITTVDEADKVYLDIINLTKKLIEKKNTEIKKKVKTNLDSAKFNTSQKDLSEYFTKLFTIECYKNEFKNNICTATTDEKNIITNIDNAYLQIINTVIKQIGDDHTKTKKKFKKKI